MIDIIYLCGKRVVLGRERGNDFVNRSLSYGEAVIVCHGAVLVGFIFILICNY